MYFYSMLLRDVSSTEYRDKRQKHKILMSRKNNISIKMNSNDITNHSQFRYYSLLHLVAVVQTGEVSVMQRSWNCNISVMSFEKRGLQF